MARRWKPARMRRRWLAPWLVHAVVLCEVAVLVGFAVDRSDPPRSGTLLQLIWALLHRPSFYPLAALILVAPPATLLAWSVRGPHRPWLLASWVLFLPALIVLHGHRLGVMLTILWRQAVGP